MESCLMPSINSNSGKKHTAAMSNTKNAYKGNLEWFSKKGPIDIPVQIEIRPIDSLENTYLWRTTYDSTAKFPQVVKDYYLVHSDTLAEGHYLIDERNGIYLDMILVDNSFYSNFEVSNSSILSIDRLQADGSLHHEIISSYFDSARNSGAESEGEYFAVKSYSKISVQKAVLSKIKE